MNSLNKRLEIVNISALKSTSNTDYNDAAGKLYSALSEIGFAIIVNHGVDEEIITDMRSAVSQVLKRHARS